MIIGPENEAIEVPAVAVQIYNNVGRLQTITPLTKKT